MTDILLIIRYISCIYNGVSEIMLPLIFRIPTYNCSSHLMIATNKSNEYYIFGVSYNWYKLL